jgi:signal transduction histidine kinase
VTLRGILPTSFRGRFLLVVVFAAVVPLALLGVWLTRSVVRAGEHLLHTELTEALNKVADGVELRWRYRSGDLALLANNDVAQRVLSADASQPLAPADSAYLGQLFANVSQTISAFEYRDVSGRERWSTPAPLPDTAGARGGRVIETRQISTMTFERLVTASHGAAPLGTMIARVYVSALLATDTSVRLPNAAKLQMVERATRRTLLPSFVPDSLLAGERFVVDGRDWLTVHRALASPEIDLALAAPLAAYVQPFQQAARTGAVTLTIVALLALALSAFFTSRLTGSLERLAVAADAVAGGDLDHRVDANGSDETGRVGAAFNSMVEHLRRTLAELSKRQALAAVGEYAAGLSHQVRNGLTAVRVDLQRAEAKLSGDVAGRPLVVRALENVKRLDATVTDSLRVARGARAPKRRIDLRRVLRSVTQSADSAFIERGSLLSPMATDGAPVWILGDQPALEQLFLNLLLNSAQALGRGGRAAIALDVDGAEVCVSVTDSGTGISPDDLEHVLEPFFSTKANGTGLGLSIARQIAAAHGGSLRIESLPGHETRVEVRLPLAAAPVAVKAR